MTQNDSALRLAGHPGTLALAGPGTLWKKVCVADSAECLAYQVYDERRQRRQLVPKFYSQVCHNGECILSDGARGVNIFDSRVDFVCDVVFSFFFSVPCLFLIAISSISYPMDSLRHCQTAQFVRFQAAVHHSFVTVPLPSYHALYP